MRKTFAVTLTIIVLAVLITSSAQFAGAAENSWLTRPAMLESAGMAVAVEGKIYAIGTITQEYDPLVLTWTKKASIPNLTSGGITSYQNKIYVIGGSYNQVYDIDTDTWVLKTAMPTERIGVQANVVGDKIYVIGGISGVSATEVGTIVNINEAYDPATDSWSTKAPIPTPVYQYASAVVDNKIFIIGGSTKPPNVVLGLVQIYDPQYDSWTTGASMPTPIRITSAVATTGVFAPVRIYVIGGLQSGNGLDLNQVYNPQTDNWITGASMPTARYSLGLAVINDTIYAMGGLLLPPYAFPKEPLTTTEVYLPFGFQGPPPPFWTPPPSPSPLPTPTLGPTETPPPTATIPTSIGSWETLSPLPQSRLYAGVAGVNGKIYVIGGLYEEALSINQEYDPATDTWATRKPLPSARSNFAMAVYQNKIYVIGGNGMFDTESVTGLNQVYDPLTDTWETLTPMPTARQSFSANVVDDKIYLIGGSKPVNLAAPSYVPNINEVYDPATDTWSSKTPPPVNVSNYASGVVDGKIYVISGFGIGKSLTQIYDPQSDSWSYGASIPTPVWGAGAAVTTGVWAPKRIYVLGGYPAFSSNQIYDPQTDTWALGSQMPTGRYGLGVAVIDDRLYVIGGSGYEAGRANERYTPAQYVSSGTPLEGLPTLLIIILVILAFVIVSVIIIYFSKKKSRLGLSCPICMG